MNNAKERKVQESEMKVEDLDHVDRGLVEKLLKGGYPEGYKPKRSTHLMPTFIEEHENDINAIHAFLNL